jgi:GT2 family glycosyltransferase
MRNTFRDLIKTLERRPSGSALQEAASEQHPDFDPAFYRHFHPALAGRSDAELWAHFLSEGWRAGADPHAGFSVALYLVHNADVAEARLNPFIHYTVSGHAEGRLTFLSLWGAEEGDAVPATHIDTVLSELDLGHLRSQMPEALRGLSDRALAAYYLVPGWRAGLDPHPDFSTEAYLKLNADVAATGENPFLHYIVQGRAEGRMTQMPAGLPTEVPGFRQKELVRDMARARPYFDPDYYRARYRDMQGNGDEEVLMHFLLHGWKEARDPAANFSTLWYIEANPDVAEAGYNPLLHYARSGRDEGRAPVPPMPDLPAAEMEALAEAFDAGFYRDSHPWLSGSDASLLQHYLTRGWREGSDPAPGFSTAWYLDDNSDVAQAGVNPFWHYLTNGRDEGRSPLPEGALPEPEPEPEETPEERRAREMALAAPYFDADFYRSRYADMNGPDDRMLAHYMIYGWREGRNPSAQFSTRYYLEANEDVAQAGVNPLLHYIEQGQDEGRLPLPAEQVAADVARSDLDAVRPQFDAGFYRATNEDLPEEIRADDAALLLHFMTQGWRDRRDPRADFSCSYYLDTYPDIAAGGINPFLHYTLFGKSEGRRPRGDEPIRMLTNPEASLTPGHLASVLMYPPEGTAARPPAQSNPQAMELHWVIPDFRRGSGGHMTIFRMIRHLELFGHRCRIWIEAPVFHETGLEAWEEIVKYFQCVEAPVDFVENGFFEASGDAVIATGWSTAFLAHRAQGFAGKFYFVQDHEPEFYPTGSERLLARQTYDLGLDCICASPWLDQIMSQTYGLWARHFFLAYDHEIYLIADEAAHQARFQPNSDGPLKIAVYARDHTARRCVYLALMSLEHLGATRSDFEVHFFGQDDLPFAETPFPAVNHGVLDAHALAALYNDCHVGICFSATNYSLVPQEMMACGLPLLELDGPSTQAIFPDGVVSLGGPDPLDIAAKLAHLLEDPKARAAQAQAALEWVQGFSWEGAGRAVEAALAERLGDLTTLAAPAVAPARDILLDVVIPTYNGMGELEPVIAALATQHGAEHIQVHCIDSASKDGTAEWLQKQPNVSFTAIDQKTFQHGRTRNDGAALGSAPIIAFLTQDALPTNPTWGVDILKMFNHVPQAAGLFGRHEPYPDHPEYVRDEITRHFANMLKFPLALSKDTDPEKWESGDRGWRQFLHFYSDNNSAMRRDVWNEIPYPEVDYGEDQVWARDIIEAGYSKLYAPTACVYHSHDYDPPETYKRSKTEGAFFYEHFGYELGTGTEEDIAKRVTREQMLFKASARKRNMPEDEIEMRLGNIAEKHRGWRDGRLEAQARLAG